MHESSSWSISREHPAKRLPVCCTCEPHWAIRESPGTGESLVAFLMNSMERDCIVCHVTRITGGGRETG